MFSERIGPDSQLHEVLFMLQEWCKGPIVCKANLLAVFLTSDAQSRSWERFCAVPLRCAALNVQPAQALWGLRWL